MAKYVVVPNPITLCDPLTKATGQTVKFSEFVTLALLTDKRFDGSYLNIKAATKVAEQVHDDNKKELVLETADWEKLKSAAEQPTSGTYNGYPSLAAQQLVPFIEAIVGATDMSQLKTEK